MVLYIMICRHISRHAARRCRLRSAGGGSGAVWASPAPPEPPRGVSPDRGIARWPRAAAEGLQESGVWGGGSGAMWGKIWGIWVPP